MIVPLSLSFSDGFETIRKLLFEKYSANWFSSYARIPAALFAADVRVRNVIHIGRKSGGTKRQWTTRLHRWFESARPHLFLTLEYARFTPSLWRNRVPKFGSERLGKSLEMHLATSTVLESALTNLPTKYQLHFKKSAYNWLNFCREQPPCYDENNRLIPHTKFGTVNFGSAQDRDIALLFLNGKIEFTFWAIVGDDFDVTKWMFTDFPYDPSKIDKCCIEKLAPLVDELEQAMKAAASFKLNAGKRVGNYNLARCRHITDQSDRIFAEHLGLCDVWDDIELLYTQIVRTNFADNLMEDTDE
jgi:hypothetical protein